MDLIAERVEVWASSIEDKPGSLAKVLTGLREAGADLNFILARRAPEAFGQAEVFVTPLQGDAELEAAATLGFNPTASVHAVRVEGPN
jgi:ACT domain-containing protein